MNKKELMKKAHKMTREIKREYPKVDYKFQLGLCLAYLCENKGGIELLELNGSEKQVKWANNIRREMIEVSDFFSNFKNVTNEQLEEYGLEDFEIEVKDFVLDLFDELYNHIKTEKNASWFITQSSRLLTKTIVVKEIINIFDIKEVFKLSKLDKEDIYFYDVSNCFYGLLTIICNKI